MNNNDKSTKYVLTTTEEILFTNKAIFKDDNEHPYNCECHDGIAYCTKVDCEENANAPEKLMLGYPRMSEIKGTAKEDACREHRGLRHCEPLNYADIAMRYGRLGKHGFTAEELNVMDKLAKRAKMDWFITTTEGNFKDGETGKEMSAKKALRELVEGLTESDYGCLKVSEIITFIKSISSLL